MLSWGARRARWLSTAGWLLVGLVLALVMGNLWSVLEGADLLLARGGIAPLPMEWLEDVEVTVRPPDYLHQKTTSSEPTGWVVLPYGSLVTVRGVPTRTRRQLMLSDGTDEVAFADDGVGHRRRRAGRSPKAVPCGSSPDLETSSFLKKVGLKITSVPDAAPEVTLEGAPRQVLLVDEVHALPIRATRQTTITGCAKCVSCFAPPRAKSGACFPVS